MERGADFPEMPRHRQLEYLLEEGVGVTEALDIDTLTLGCPPGWSGVWDERGGYIAYFQHEEDAYAFRLLLITMRQQGKQIAARYKKRKK